VGGVRSPLSKKKIADTAIRKVYPPPIILRRVCRDSQFIHFCDHKCCQAVKANKQEKQAQAGNEKRETSTIKEAAEISKRETSTVKEAAEKSRKREKENLNRKEAAEISRKRAAAHISPLPLPLQPLPSAQPLLPL
jgi:protein subunit release factor B